MTTSRHRAPAPKVTRKLAAYAVLAAAWLVGLVAGFWALVFVVVGGRELWQQTVTVPLDGQPVEWGQVVSAALFTVIGAAVLWGCGLLMSRWGPRVAEAAGGPLPRATGTGSGGGFFGGGGGGFFGGGDCGGGGGGDGGGC